MYIRSYVSVLCNCPPPRLLKAILVKLSHNNPLINQLFSLCGTLLLCFLQLLMIDGIKHSIAIYVGMVPDINCLRFGFVIGFMYKL